jgi:hypothetical protein
MVSLRSQVIALVAVDVGFGSVFAVRRGPSTAHHDVVVHEAGIGQIATFETNT